jgi:hypothetical protein
VLEGIVQDTIGNKPVNGAVITITDSSQDIISYGLTDVKGFFHVKINSGEKVLDLNVSFLGYTSKTIKINNTPQTINITLKPSEIQLKEVVIKSEIMWNKEDTLVYSVSAFRSQQDRTIGDILKKLPGIEVSQNGGIKYNGEPINKFYIEGLDLLDRKYGIATNNVPVDAVTNVEVIENHQPVKALKDMISTGQAAINLKLRNNKMVRPVGTVKVGTGGIEDLLWVIDAFALQANKKRQAIVMYKTNNTGNNISDELTEHSLSYTSIKSDNRTAISGLFNDLKINSPPIEEERYLFNKTHVATINNLWKTGEDNQLRMNISYLHDVRDEFVYQDSFYFLPDSTLYINEQRNTHKKNNYIDGIITYTDNSAKYYINNVLKGWTKWNKFCSGIENSNIIRQKFDIPEYFISNDMQYVKKWDNRIWDVTSFVRYASLPQSLKVNTDTTNENVIQKVNHSGLYTSNNSSLSFSKGSSRLYLNLNTEGYIENLNSDLSNHPVLTNRLLNKIKTDYLKVTVNPSYSQKKNKIEFLIDMPVSYHWLETKDKFLNKTKHRDFLYIDPRIKLTYKINQLWETSFLYQYNHNIGDITDFAESYIMTDYRTASIKAGILQERENRSGSIKASFRNPLTTLFFNALVSCSYSKRNLLDQQYFTGNQSIIGSVEQKNRFEVWTWRTYLGKYFGDIKTGFSILLNCSLTKSEKNQQGLLVPLNSVYWNLTPKINTKIYDALSVSYQAELINNKLSAKSSQNQLNSSVCQVSQKLTVHYFLNSKIELNARLEHLYNEFTAVKISHFFADAGIYYQLKNGIELSLAYKNIFNRDNYSYTVTNELDRYSYVYKLRPTIVFASVLFKY